jgi:hypothetical protein
MTGDVAVSPEPQAFLRTHLGKRKKINGNLCLIRDEVNPPEVHAGHGKWAIWVQVIQPA